MDLYQLLKQDHQKAKRLFEQLSDTSDRAVKSRDRLFAQLKQELELHTQVEEEHFYPALRDEEETKDLVEEALEEHNDVKELLGGPGILSGYGLTEAPILTMSTASLRVNQRLFNVIDPISCLDRCAQQPVANRVPG